ncbi:hypothetical protein [Ammoniphilus resinae]|uniref:Uncharacterized protein n=1 Tax=Ammoniphilus resinae TaxID=861532 RepID=A0ABS4GU33_9BACL|nr:hypothetical protein [Ammoniphilus resinae]MBP1933780.1 hypothetical protein [Ammoniphilus resinae]
MYAREVLQTALTDQGISTEIVGDAIYRFTQYECEWMVPQHIINQMLDRNDVDQTTNFIASKLFYLVRRIDEE